MAAEPQATMEGVSSATDRLKEMMVDFAAGSVGGMACVLTGQPLDTIKVKLQTYPQLYRNTTTCTRLLWREGYFRPFYRGSAPAVVCSFAEKSILFLAYGQCLDLIASLSGQKVERLSSCQKASAGSLASFFSSLALCPLELIKCRLQANPSSKQYSSASIVRTVIQQHGFFGVYRGFSMTLAREMPGYFFMFGGYEGSRQLALSLFPDKKATDPDVVLFAGGMSGVIFWASIYPLDVIKTRQQVLSLSGANLSFALILKQIIAEQGFLGLYGGVIPCILRAFPANAALFFGYETTKKLLS